VAREVRGDQDYCTADAPAGVSVARPPVDTSERPSHRAGPESVSGDRVGPPKPVAVESTPAGHSWQPVGDLFDRCQYDDGSVWG